MNKKPNSSDVWNKKPNSPDIWNKKPIAEDEMVVKVQRMFPNCEKYNKCCTDSGYEELMNKVKKVSNYEEMIEDILEEAKNES